MIDRRPFPLGIVASGVLGLICAGAAVLLQSAKPKVFLALLFAMLLLLIALSLGRKIRAFYFFLALFALSIPLNIDVNLFYRPHVGGAPSIAISASMLALLALYVIMGYDRATGEEIFSRRCHRPLLYAIACYVAVAFFSLVNADYPELTLFQLVRLCILFSAFFLVMNLKSGDHIEKLVLLLSVGVFVEAVLAVIQYKTGTRLGLGIFGEEELVSQNIGRIVHRATGTIGHPNALGYFFEMLIPVVFAMSFVARDRWIRLWYLLVFACALLGLVTTLSRGAWITVPMSVSVVSLGLFWNSRPTLKGAMVVVAVGVALLIALPYVYPTIRNRLLHDDYKSAESRIPLNEATVSVIEQFPVFGVGLNNFSEVFKKYDTTGKSRIFKGYKQVVHNVYLLVCAELGIPGLVAFLSMFAAVFASVARYRNRVARPHQGILIGIAAGLLAHLVHGFFDTGFVGTSMIAMLVFTLFGLVGAICVRRRDDRDDGLVCGGGT